MEDEEPAWKDAARFAAKIWRHPKTHSSLFIFACTCVLTAAALHSGTYYTPTVDVIVYCLIYSLWLTICLPWLVKYLDKKTVLLVVGVLFRLFAAEIGVLLWGLVRGHGYFLQRALRLKPLLEPSLLWLSEAGYNLRYGVIVSASVAAILVTLTNLLENTGRGHCNVGFVTPGVGDRKRASTSEQAQLKSLNQDDLDLDSPSMAARLNDSPDSGRTFLADDSPPSEPCRLGQQEPREPSPVLHGISSLLSFSLPDWERNSPRRDKRSGMRSRIGDHHTSVGTQKNQSQVVDKLYVRKGQCDDPWKDYSSSNTSHSKRESFAWRDRKRNRGRSVDLPLKSKSRGFSPAVAGEVDTNCQSSQPINVDLPSVAKSKLKPRLSSSCASSNSISDGRELRKHMRTRRGQRLGRSLCPIELKGSPTRRLTREKMSRGDSRTQAVYLRQDIKTGSD